MNVNQKFKVKEFQWFQMETRVRQMVQEILTPIQKRIMEHSTHLTKLKQSQHSDSQKVQQLTMLVTNDPKIFQIGIFKQVDQRFQVHQKGFQQVRRLIQQSNKFVDQKFKLLDLRMKQSHEIMVSFANLKDRVNKEIQLQNDNIQKVRLNLQQMIQKVSCDITKTNDKIAQNLMSSQKTSKQLQQRIRQTQLSIAVIQQKLQNNKKLIMDKNIQLQTHEFKLQKAFEKLKDLESGMSISQKMEQYIKDMEISIRKCEFRVEAVTPLVTMAQLQEALQYILPQKLRKKIIIFGYKKYSKLNRQILDKSYDQVKQKFNGLDLIQSMQKKNMRQVTSLKRKKIISMGIDIDHLTFEARQRYYQQVDMDQLTQQQQDNQNHAKIDQAQILNLVSLYFNEFTTDVSQKVKNQLQDTKAYLYGMENQLKKQMEMNCLKVKKTEEHCVQFHRDQMLEIKAIQSHVEDVERGKNEVMEWLARGQEVERKFYNFCSLINHLQIQEQIDKQNISLMGIQEHRPTPEKGSNPIQKNSIIQLDKNCFSCCGYPASVLSSFKMACLAYHPTGIQIDGKEYRREDILQFTTNLLQTIKGTLQINTQSSELLTNQENSSDRQKVHRREDFRTIHSRKGAESPFQTLERFGNARIQEIVNEKKSYEQTTIHDLNSKMTMRPPQQSTQKERHLKSSSMRMRKSLRKSPAVVIEDKSRSYNNSHKKNSSSELSKDMIVVTNNFMELKRRHLSSLG